MTNSIERPTEELVVCSGAEFNVHWKCGQFQNKLVCHHLKPHSEQLDCAVPCCGHMCQSTFERIVQLTIKSRIG